MAPLFLTGLSSAQYTAVGSPIEIELLPFELFWAKLALMVAFALTVIVFSNIAKILFISDKREASMTTIVFATSPIAFFAFGIFNQYDIFGVLLTLLAILNILRGRWLLFAVFFGLAATFKFFAILLALPLTLLFVPTWRRRIATGLVILMTPVLFAIPYISSVPFREGVLRLVSDRASSGSFLSVIVFTVVIYGAINLWAWHLSRTKQDPNKPFVIISVATYALLFNSVNFHPQWLIIITPFLALAVGYVRHVKLFLLAETFAFSMFTWYVLVTYKDNVDGTMVMNGPLSSVFENPMFPVSVFYPPIPSGIGLLVFKAMILALPALIFYFGLKNRKAEEGVIMTVTLGLRSISPLFLVLIPSLIPVLV
jgi:Gpi18-like mannosyltransferase